MQTKPNQFSVSYHIAQYTNIIADLRKEIFRLKLKISEHGEESGDGSSRKSKPLPRGVCWQANMSHDDFNNNLVIDIREVKLRDCGPMEFVWFVESQRCNTYP